MVEIKLFKSLWEYVSFDGTPQTITIKLKKDLDRHLNWIAESGYNGVESPLPCEEQEEWFVKLLDQYQLEFIPQLLTKGNHRDSFEIQATRAAQFQPLKIVSQSAKDSMTFDQQIQFFQEAIQIENKLQVPVAHETHRGTALFTPWNTAAILKKIKGLKLNADFSHWCCVCESMLETEEEHVSIATQSAIHIHGRVGYPEGPQVSDPRAPEYQVELERHEYWWDQIVKARLSRGETTITFTPEFGPYSYMQVLPYTKQPVSDIWEINLWIADRFRTKHDHRIM